MSVLMRLFYLYFVLHIRAKMHIYFFYMYLYIEDNKIFVFNFVQNVKLMLCVGCWVLGHLDDIPKIHNPRPRPRSYASQMSRPPTLCSQGFTRTSADSMFHRSTLFCVGLKHTMSIHLCRMHRTTSFADNFLWTCCQPYFVGQLNRLSTQFSEFS